MIEVGHVMIEFQIFSVVQLNQSQSLRKASCFQERIA